MRLLILLVPFIMFLPSVTKGPPVAGVGGWATPEQLQELGATWFHQWNLCTKSGGAYTMPDACVSVLQSETQFSEEAVIADLQVCSSGWFMVGDEWNLPSWPTYYNDYERQAAAFHWLKALRDEYNPDCKLAFGGYLASHYGNGFVTQFRDAYIALYGEPPQFEAFVVDSYDWPGRDWPAEAAVVARLIRETYPGVQVWAREVGCLVNHECAVAAMGKLPWVASVFDRWAWFITTHPGWEYTSLYTPEGDLTDLGELYRSGFGD